MEAGDLSWRITIRRAMVTTGDFNEPVETFADLATVWAKKRDASAGESYRAQEVGSQISTRFTIRWAALLANVDPQDQITHDGRSYNITAVRESGHKHWIEIDAVASAEAGV